MTPRNEISQRSLDTQRRVFRVACDPLRYGLTYKMIAIDSGIAESNLRGYAAGAVAMPFSALLALLPVLPAELLSAFLPDDRSIVRRSKADHDGLAALCMDFAGEVVRAHHPDSEAGIDIGPGEQSSLDGKVAQIRA